MKGIAKFAKRTPHLLQGKVGMAAKSQDAAFDELERRFTLHEKNAEKLLKDSTTFRDSVRNMLMSGAGFGASFAHIFSPLGDEYDISKTHANAANTSRYLAEYQTVMEELRETLSPEIELIDSRIITPINEFLAVIKSIRKNITKRNHKLVDYDRHNNSFSKLKEKKEKTLKDEQNMFKVEQDFEAAAADYEFYNNAMKEELPRFFEMCNRFIGPLFHSFYYMQLNVFYLTLDKLQTYANGKYDISQSAPGSVEDNYVAALQDTAERLEALTIRRPVAPNARILQQAHAKGGSEGKRVGSYGSASSAAAAAPPPAYSAGSSAAVKRAPPPPPVKPKPGAAPAKEYVTALYDYAATAEGDLSFKAGDRIEVVERTASTEDWWKGIVNGQTGVFPGNYVSTE